MATALLLPQDSTINFSNSLRAPYSSAHPPSMAESLPAMNFGFDDLRDRMSAFTMRFDEFIERGRKRVLEERNQFRMNVAEQQEEKRQRERAIADLATKHESHAASLALQTAETNEMHDAITSLTQTRETHAATVTDLRAKIAALKSTVATKKEAQRQTRAYLDTQAARNGPELKFWESHLGLRIEGVGKPDHLRFCFSCVDERMSEREGVFELDMEGGQGRREYEVVMTRPRLEMEKVDVIVKALCEGRDLGVFLKAMRGLFVEVFR